MNAESKMITIKFRLNRQKSCTLIEERTEEECSRVSKSCGRSITPKFIRSKKIELPKPVQPFKLKPVFLKLEKKILEKNESKPRTAKNSSFQEQLKSYQCFVKSSTNEDQRLAGKADLRRDNQMQNKASQSLNKRDSNLSLECSLANRLLPKKKGCNHIAVNSGDVGSLNTFKTPSIQIEGSRTSVDAIIHSIELNEEFQLRSPPGSPTKSILKKRNEVLVCKKFRGVSEEISECTSPGKKVTFSRTTQFLELYKIGEQPN